MSKRRLAGIGFDNLLKQVKTSARSNVTTYTEHVLDNPDLLRAKILEEAEEIVDFESKENLVHEMADILYFLTILAYREGVEWEDVFEELKTREE